MEKVAFIKPMLLVPSTELPDASAKWLVELKYEGWRSVAFKSEGTLSPLPQRQRLQRLSTIWRRSCPGRNNRVRPLFNVTNFSADCAAPIDPPLGTNSPIVKIDNRKVQNPLLHCSFSSIISRHLLAGGLLVVHQAAKEVLFASIPIKTDTLNSRPKSSALAPVDLIGSQFDGISQSVAGFSLIWAWIRLSRQII